MHPVTPFGVIILVFLLEAKHFVCDGPLQTRAMIAEKSIYGGRMGLVHSAVHGVGSMVVLAVLEIGWMLVAVLSIAEAALHYHIDYGKENVVKLMGWSSRDRMFWWSLAGDQALHHFTYLAMAAVIVLWLA